MKHDQLQILHAIVTEGTFRAAANKLNKSQSAISHMLKKLEDEIGITLLSREEYRPKLTPEGAVFYRQATRVLQQMQQLGDTVKQLSAEQEAEVSLAVTATYPLAPFLKVIREISDVFPSTHIRLFRENMGGALERLKMDEADIILSTLDNVDTSLVETIPFASMTIIPVAHPDYAPVREQGFKTIQDMQPYTQVIVSDSSHSDTEEQSRDLLPGGLRWTVSDFASKKEILLEQMGWGGIPEYLIRDELKTGALVPLNIEGYPPRRSQLHLLRRRDKNPGTVARTLWERLTEIREKGF